MKMLSFLGETPTEALRNAQKECGEDAIVISTKKISSKGKNSKNMYEILVATEDEYDANINKIKPIIPEYSHRQSYNNTDGDNYNIKSDILQIHDDIRKVQKSLWEPKSKLYDLVIPTEFIDIYSLFEQNEFDEEMTYTILKKNDYTVTFINENK